MELRFFHQSVLSTILLFKITCSMFDVKKRGGRAESDKGKMKEKQFSFDWRVREKMHKWLSFGSTMPQNDCNHLKRVLECDNAARQNQIQTFSRSKVNRKNFARGALAWGESLQKFSFFFLAIIFLRWHFGAQFHLNYPQNALLLRNNHWLEAPNIGSTEFLVFFCWAIIFPSFAVY